MSKFKTCLKEELSNEIAYGENGMPAYKKAGDKSLEFFYAMGALRGNSSLCVSLFQIAFKESPIVAIKLAFLLRDVRSGNGERESFREIMKVLEKTNSEMLIKVLPLIPKYGRWDDLEIFTTTSVRKSVYKLIGKGLKNPETSGLCAKWISRNDKGDKFISGLRSYLKLSPKDFRQKLVFLCSTLEQKMSAKEWDTIDYNKVPSQAMSKHHQAFLRNDKENYENYIQGLSNGKTKVNASTLYPYQIINRNSVYKGDASEWAVKEAAWNALPNYFDGEEATSSILPMIDVSGSMSCNAGKTSITCMDVAVSLGMYISSKQKGSFKNTYLTFHSEPKLNIFDTNVLKEDAKSIYEASWGGTTDVEKAFKKVLNFAIENKVPSADMPKVIMILSDMNFNMATRNTNNNAITMIEGIYEGTGYETPKLVFWNLHHNGSFVAKKDTNGVMMLSGFSASLIKDLVQMTNEAEVSPLKLMHKAIERYDDVGKALS